MKTLRDQIIARITNLGGEQAEYYADFSDYDLLEDYEELFRTVIEEEYLADKHDTTTPENTDS